MEFRDSQFLSYVTLQNPPPTAAADQGSSSSSPHIHASIRYVVTRRDICRFPDGKLTLLRESTESRPPSLFHYLGPLERMYVSPSQFFGRLSRVLTRNGVPDPERHEQLGRFLARKVEEFARLPRRVGEKLLQLEWMVERVENHLWCYPDARSGRCPSRESVMEEVRAALSVREQRRTSGYAMVPTAPGAFAKLAVVEVDSDGGGENCVICLEELLVSGGSSKAAAMPCKHMFHEGCIVGWLKTSHYCPVCRFEMPGVSTI